MSELLDYFDDKLNWLGTATREEVHKTGLWHQTFHCWIIRKSGNKKYVLFQRRSAEKKSYPNALDITAAGHLLAGETKEDGLRELNEELGIDAQLSDLNYLGIRMSSAKVGDSIVNQEFAHVYLLEWDIALQDYKLQENEVSGIVQVELNNGLKLLSGEVDKVSAEGYQVNKNGQKEPVEINIGLSDIIPRIDNYYYKIFIMTERYFNGNQHICI